MPVKSGLRLKIMNKLEKGIFKKYSCWSKGHSLCLFSINLWENEALPNLSSINIPNIWLKYLREFKYKELFNIATLKFTYHMDLLYYKMFIFWRWLYAKENFITADDPLVVCDTCCSKCVLWHLWTKFHFIINVLFA